MATIVHKLSTMGALGQSLLVQLANVKNFMTDPRVRPEVALAQNQKLAKTISSKFPEIPQADKITGLETVTKGNLQDTMTTIEPHFFTFVDVVDFHDLALSVLADAVAEIPELKIDVNPDLCELFYDLYVVWIQVTLLANQIEERKLLLSFHSVLYSVMHAGSKDLSSAKVFQFMKDHHDHPLKKMWEDLKLVSPRALQNLVTMFPNWIKIRNVEVLRNDGTLSLSAAPQKLSFPTTGAIYDDLLRCSKANQWFYYGFLFSPEELCNNQQAQDIIRYVIADTLSAAIFRDESLPLHKEWEELSSYKTKTVSMSKAKKAFKEGFSDAYSKCGLTHRDRRLFVRQELLILSSLFTDTPALICPKLPLLLSALSMAKDELFWYFRHRQPPNKSKLNMAHFDDSNVPELIHIVLQLQSQLRSMKDAIILYYVQYLAGADTTRLDELINAAEFKSNVDQDVQTVLGWMIGWLRTAEVGRHFGEVRQKWAETQTRFLGIRTIKHSIIAPVVERVQQIMFHTKVVDSFEEMISEHVSLRSLWYFKSEVQSAFERALIEGSPSTIVFSASPSSLSGGSSPSGGSSSTIGQTAGPASNSNSMNPANPNQHALYALTFLVLASQSVENATVFDPFEKDRLGQDAVLASLDFLKKFMDVLLKHLEDNAKIQLEFELQLEDVKSTDMFIHKMNELVSGDGRKIEKVAAVVHPGTESSFSNRPQFSFLRATQRQLWQLLSSLDSFGSILIYNTLLTPREFLVSRLKKFFKSFLERNRYLPSDKSPFKDDATFIPPSQLVRQIRVYANVIKQLDSHIQLDTDLIINQVLLKQIHSSSLGLIGGKLDWMTDKGFEYTDNIIKVVAKWYSDFFARRITNPSLNVVYSANKKGFVSRHGQQFKAEKYLDFVELCKLAQVIGPYGFKIIDREILRFVVSNMSTLLATLRALKNELTELMTGYSQETVTTQILKTLKSSDLDSFIGSSIVIGNALTFRKLMYEALGEVTSRTIPHLYNTVSNAFHQYARNTFMAIDFVGMDSMAQDAGINVSIADQPLKVALLPLSQSDRALWELLPAAYAASFLLSTHWKDAIYNPSIEAFENNVHVLQYTISDLLINFKALSGEGDSEERSIREHIVKFLDISGTILLRALASPKLDPKLVPKDFASLFVFMDLFVQNCPLLTRSELESILPYSLLRSMWRSIYSRIGKSGKAEDGDDVF